MRLVCLAVVLVLAAVPVSAEPFTIKGVTYRVNESLSPAPRIWLASDVGWLWTPSQTFTLTTWSTRFFVAGPSRIVTAEIYDAPPALGGQLLARDEFPSGFFGFYRIDFPFLELVKGEDYFFGFKNVAGLGVNFTNAPGATSLGPLYHSFDGAGTYALTDPAPGVAGQPLFQFFGHRRVPIPEPATSALLLVGVAAIVRRRRRRWRDGSSPR